MKMVYYFTSRNVKLMRNINIDYEAADDTSPYEYMKNYIEKCAEDIEDTKLAWIAKTFLGIQKHEGFFKAVALHLSEELTEEDQYYLIIMLYAIIFQIDPNNLLHVYKCLFNLNKSLLDTFTKFLSTDEVLPSISLIAHDFYDTNFITEKIINPLFIWQPYINEMMQRYAEHIEQVEKRKIKPPVIPKQPNVLNRKPKRTAILKTSIPVTPPNSVGHKNKRMLTKSAIDRKLKESHNQNKLKALNLLKEVRNMTTQNDNLFEKSKSNKKTQPSLNTKDDTDDPSQLFPKPRQNFIIKHTNKQIKDTAATVIRLRKRIEATEEKEVEWLHNIVNNCRNTAKIEELEENYRQEQERERLVDIEKKHIMGQISHEEALLAKKKVYEYNKRKYEEFLKEKEQWTEEIEQWKKNQLEKNTKNIERLSLIEFNLLAAKNNAFNKKKEFVESVKKESLLIRENAKKIEQQDLEHKINMIKEIKILEEIAKKARIPKIIDLTETSGIGLLCEMSIAELQERICAMKISFQEELERKKTLIKEENNSAKQELKESKETIKQYMNERAAMRKLNKNKFSNDPKKCSIQNQEIEDLKKILDEKRKLRMQLTNEKI